MLTEILRLDLLIAECLKETEKLKTIAVSAHQYEQAAQLRTFEKEFEKIKDSLSGPPYLFIPSKGLTRNGATYSSQLFGYGTSLGWKNLPTYITNLFQARKSELNAVMAHSEATVEHLISLNSRLMVEESRINDFIKSLHLIFHKKSLASIIDDISEHGTIFIQFLTSKEFRRSPRNDGAAKWELYEIDIYIDHWIMNKKAYYDHPESYSPDNSFLQALPATLRDEKICYLFHYLGTHGLLALQDMLNIHQVLISFPFLYRLKRI